MITDVWFYLAAIPAILITGISKGGFGGLVMLAVPLLALVISPVQAAAIMLPVLCFTDLFSTWAFRKTWSGENLKVLIPSACLGIIIGTLTFSLLNDSWIRLIVGGIAIGFTLNHWLGESVSQSRKKASWWKGSFLGTVAGFTSFVAHSGAPPLYLYLLPQKLNKTILVGTAVIFFSVTNYIKLIPYAWLGQFKSENLITSLILTPLAFLGVQIGIWLHHRIDEALLYRIWYTLLFLTGLKLVYDGAITFY